MVSKTTLNLDRTLAEEVREALGARTITEAIHVALENERRRQTLGRLSEWPLGDLSLERVADLRSGRSVTGE